ncbi:MAG TPA: patatin-like phospholipase family protein [Pyrinomonadaceae bacterium]|nr:patatin-like phospholipase family protein [Pyrinomonadaceae bacterium]
MSEQQSANLERARRILRGEDASTEEIYRLVDALKAEEQFRIARKLQEKADTRLARDILRSGTATDDEKLRLAMELKNENQFGLARKLLARIDVGKIADVKRRRFVGQQRSLCTYKDPDLSNDSRLARALAILESVDDLKTTADQETLGQAGAIHKRMWEIDAQKQHLERSLNFYRRGYKAKTSEDEDYDNGWTGINAAYVLDLLAFQEEREAESAGAVSESAEARRREAAEIREDLVKTLNALAERPGKEGLKNEWWFQVTLAQAYFGLGEYTEALPALLKAAEVRDVPEWQREATTRQLASLAELRPGAGDDGASSEDDEARRVLSQFLDAMGDKSGAGIESASYGKIGLALSGGGFRASLFHIGVLAKLAELGLLHRVEVISCVSGGSIIGAHYYLEVKRLLESKTDEEIKANNYRDYIEIVERITRDFVEGVQRNIRTRVAAELSTNLKMVLFPNYSRTKRAGELYERELYGRINDGNGAKPRYMTDLFIRPKGAPENFKPKYDNWGRQAKVPDLILNATSLNTGHNWQFTASWMGEPPAGIDSEIDSNYRLRRVYHGDVPNVYRTKKRIRLGDAVGASACVPALFEPIALPMLYGQLGDEPKEITVRLVDGGVHDNQGIVSLLEQGCTQVIVSDASGQMDALDDPSSGLLSVPTRSNSILMARVREAQYNELVARHRSSLLKGLVFVHLKKDLSDRPVDWIECNDRYDASEDARGVDTQGDLTGYKVKREIQRLLAATRTDLDSFSDTESYALMMSGYAMIEEAHLKNRMKSFPLAPVVKRDWKFLALRDAMKGGKGYVELEKRLKVSHMRGFKIWKLNPWLKILAWVLGVIAALGVGWFLWRNWSTEQEAYKLVIPLALLFVIVVGALLVHVLGPPVQRLLHWRKTPSEFGLGLAMATFGFIAARLHLWIFDRLFLSNGRIEKVTGEAPGRAPEQSAVPGD